MNSKRQKTLQIEIEDGSLSRLFAYDSTESEQTSTSVWPGGADSRFVDVTLCEGEGRLGGNGRRHLFSDTRMRTSNKGGAKMESL